MSEQIIPMSASQIIDYVVNHFENNRRSMGADGFCKYNGLNGEHCAFAILCENPEGFVEGWFPGTLINKRIAKLKPEFAGQSTYFYQDIQSLHDYNDFWIETETGNELSQDGIEKVKELKKLYK